MPTYEYTCENGHDETRVCSVSCMQNPIQCSVCGTVSSMVFRSAPNVVVPKDFYSRALGINVANKSEVADMARRYNDRTGGHLVEAGTEDLNKHIKPQRTSWDDVRGADF